MENESFIRYIDRVTQLLSCGELTYDDWGVAIFGRVLYETETIRRISVAIKEILARCRDEDEANADTELTSLIEQYKTERMKLAEENRQYNAALRAEARNDLFYERIVGAIEKLPPIVAKVGTVEPKVGADGVLLLSDFHAGSNYEIKGLYGEIVNKYDYNIMCDRMWGLLDKLEADDMVYDKLTIGILGDCFEGILRESSLLKLQEPVLDTVIRFSEFLANWFAEAHNRLGVPIEVVLVGGNHDVQRLLGSKPMFEGENLCKIVVEFLKLRLKEIDGIKIDDYADTSIKTIRGVNVLFDHGTDGDLEKTINYFSNLYNMDCDIMYAGHLHGISVKTAGITDFGDRTLRRVGSICGVDTFAKKIRQASRPSCHFDLYDDDGLSWGKDYYL